MRFRAWLVAVIVSLTSAPASHAQNVSTEMENYVRKYRQLFSAPKYVDSVTAHGEEDAETKAAIAEQVKHMSDQIVRDAQLGDSPLGDERIFLLSHLVHVLRFELAAHPRPASDVTSLKFAACSKQLNESLNKGDFQSWGVGHEAALQCMPIPADTSTKEATRVVVAYVNGLIASDEKLPKSADAATGKAGAQQ